MKRVVIGVVLAIVAFLVIGARAGVLDMLDPEYCRHHPHRPRSTAFHDERLSLLPPGPACHFTTSGGEVVVEGPGWVPALVAAGSIGAGLVAMRISSRGV